MTDDQLSLLDLPAARAARDDGVARVDRHPADAGWQDAVDESIRWFASTGREFTVDDIRNDMRAEEVGEPHHDNAWGARFTAAARRGVIRRVVVEVDGEVIPVTRQSARPAGHARAVAVWRGVGM